MPDERRRIQQAHERAENAATGIRQGLQEHHLTLDRLGALAVQAEHLLSALALMYNTLWDESEHAGVVNVRINRRISPPKTRNLHAR